MSDSIQHKLWKIIGQNTSEPEHQWLQENGGLDAMGIMTAFVASPRFLKKKIISLSTKEAQELDSEIQGFSVSGWSLVRLCRVWLLTQLDAGTKEAYVKNIETLFDTAEMNELVALYSALPLLAYPEQWVFRATDAVRSNMGFVFDAIALHNPFPKKYFSEAAWNQLVLKTIFNDKPIDYIDGLDTRVNEKLALVLSDFAHERWAAGRSVAPQVWRLTSKFMNDTLVADMQYLLNSDLLPNQQAAAIALLESNYQPARELISKYPDLKEAVESGELSWTNLETTDLNTYVPQP